PAAAPTRTLTSNTTGTGAMAGSGPTLEDLPGHIRDLVDRQSLGRERALAVRLQLPQLLGELYGPHDLQCGPKVPHPGACPEGLQELIKERAVLVSDCETQRRCAHGLPPNSPVPALGSDYFGCIPDAICRICCRATSRTRPTRRLTSNGRTSGQIDTVWVQSCAERSRRAAFRRHVRAMQRRGQPWPSLMIRPFDWPSRATTTRSSLRATHRSSTARHGTPGWVASPTSWRFATGSGRRAKPTPTAGPTRRCRRVRRARRRRLSS